MTGIAKFEKAAVYVDKQFKPEEFNHFKIAPNMPDLMETFGLFAKDCSITKQGGNLKSIEKVE